MNKNKICVYAICKDEMKFIDRWIESMSEADYIVVMDTGSTDGTFEKLQADPRITKVEQKIINPWRFDVARNESMTLIPEDSVICVCTDPDEVFEPGWADVLRNNWNADVHQQAVYTYVWQHDSAGKPQRVLLYDKIHARTGWHWKFPVHECVLRDDEQPPEEKTILNVLNENVILHHWQDLDKSRKGYFPLIKLRAQEHPEDILTQFHLVHEYFYNNEYQNCIDLSNQLLTEQRSLLSTNYISSLYLFMGDAYCDQHLLDQAIECYTKGIEADNTFLELYVATGQARLMQRDIQGTIEILEAGRAHASRYYSWFDRGLPSDEEELYHLLGCCYVDVGDLDKGFVNLAKALMLNPNNQDTLSDYQLVYNALFSSVGNIETVNKIILYK
jgi:tetratricopeptide (TPR) repeat protein